jgi:tRNA pseudouridine55 synthase
MVTSAPDAGGLLLVDKPAGMTSHDVVAIVRRAAGARRVGHTGTLDPFATGLLVVLVGRGTRLIPYIDGEPKVYEAVIRLAPKPTPTMDRRRDPHVSDAHQCGDR